MTENQIRTLQLWAILTFSATYGETVTYGKVRIGLGYSTKGNAGKQLSGHLGVVQKFCHETGKKCLTSIIVSQDDEVGSGFVIPSGKTLKECQQEVFDCGNSWSEHHQEFCDWVAEM